MFNKQNDILQLNHKKIQTKIITINKKQTKMNQKNIGNGKRKEKEKEKENKKILKCDTKFDITL